MIQIATYNTLCQSFVDTIAELAAYHLVATDSHAVNRLTGAKGNILIAVYPSASRSGKPGTSIDNNTILLYVINKFTPSNPKQTELDQYTITQQIIEQIRDIILADQEDNKCSPFFRLSPDSITIDPEYNTFGGFNGWSMTLTF